MHERDFPDPVLLGRVVLTTEITAITGLHIGGTNAGISIGGCDLTVVRNPLTNQPYIPGSSLKGKMRSLLERALGKPQEEIVRAKERQEKRKIHFCTNQEAYDSCEVCNIFGATPQELVPYPTRIVVRDAPLTDASRRELENANTDMPYTEIKTEVVIDRLTSAATPRQLERVPAGARFDCQIIYNIYRNPEDVRWFNYLLLAMYLVEGDFLGGQGSRGSGRVSLGCPTAVCHTFNGGPLQFHPPLPDGTRRLEQMTDTWEGLLRA